MAAPNRPKPIRVIIVDDHPMLREGTHLCLEREEDIDVVGVASDGAEGLRLVAACRPEVLILDIHLPDISGIEVARRVRMDFPSVAVLILTGYDEVGYLRALLKLGVRGYLPKTAGELEIVGAVRAVAEGQPIIMGQMASAALADDAVQLTAREYEVLQMIAAGRRNAEIAEVLFISPKTAEFHVHQILRKLKAQSRAEAICKAHQHNLILPANPPYPLPGA